MTAMDELASRAIFAARLFERAAHDPGPWTLTWGPHEVDAQRITSEQGVTFRGFFAEACYLAPPEPNVTLRCDGEVMAVRAIDFPGDAAFAVTWELAARVLSGDRRH